MAVWRARVLVQAAGDIARQGCHKRHERSTPSAWAARTAARHLAGFLGNGGIGPEANARTSPVAPDEDRRDWNVSLRAGCRIRTDGHTADGGGADRGRRAVLHQCRGARAARSALAVLSGSVI